MPKHLLIWLALLISFVLLAFLPTWNEVQRRSSKGSDFATYYYAVKVAQSVDQDLLISLESPISSQAFIRDLKARFYHRQTALFISKNTASFQAVARLKTKLRQKGIELRLDSSKSSQRVKRKRAAANGFLFFLETSQSNDQAFELYVDSRWKKTVLANELEIELTAALAETSGTYLPTKSGVLVRPAGEATSPIILGFEKQKVSSIVDALGQPLDKASFGTALPNPNSPYDSQVLSRSAKQDLIRVDKNNDGRIDANEIIGRKSVHPYLYPPPALIFTAWVSLFSLPVAYIVFHGVLWVCFLACLVLFRRWLRTPWYALALFAIVFSPVTDAIKMGQINLIVLAAIILAIYKRSGLALSVAGMIKMSPALLMAPFALFGDKFYPLKAFLGALLLSLLVLPWVGFGDQFNFYSVLLPQFSSGEYLGLKIPIDMPGNHSLPNLCHQLWPGESIYVLSSTAKKASSVLLLLFFTALSAWAFRYRKGGIRALEEMCGAFVSLMVLTPVYAYEHHMVFMAVPLFLVFRHLRETSSPLVAKLLFVCTAVFLSLPWPWIKGWGRESATFNWVLQESKCISCLIVMGLCLWAAKRTHSAFKAL